LLVSHSACHSERSEESDPSPSRGDLIRVGKHRFLRIVDADRESPS